MVLRVDLSGKMLQSAHALYMDFVVSNEKRNYTLGLGSYTGEFGHLHDGVILLQQQRQQQQQQLLLLLLLLLFTHFDCLIKSHSKKSHTHQGRPGVGGLVVYQYTRKKFAKIPQNTQNSSKYTQNYTQVYFIPEIQRKWYTEYPYLSCNIPYTRFKKPLYTVYPKTLADPDPWRVQNVALVLSEVKNLYWIHILLKNLKIHFSFFDWRHCYLMISK